MAKRQGRKQTEATRLPPVGFWSYARQDDQLSSGRLTALRSLLVQELQQQYGRDPVRLFQDNDTIPHGSDWEEEIRKAIGASTFFIPILTPNFVQSEWCCREVELFIEREQALRAQHPELAGSSRIFPILFIGIEDADPEDPAVLAALQKLQWFDFRRFRHRSFDDPEIREALSDFAGTMRSLLKARLGSAASASGPEGDVRPEETPANKTGAAERSTAPTEIVETASSTSRPATDSRPARPIDVGDVLNHMFEVKRFIKAGGMGQVFEGTNALTGERVAIKALLPALAADPKVTQLFQREAMTLTRLSHEALVQYRAMAKEPELGVLYIVTEYVDGVDLGEVLDQVQCDSGDLERLLARLAAGLAAAHRLGAIHRDISPDNIMLPGGDLRQAKIIDFGIAKDLGGALPTLIGEGFAGKLSFVAPEQLGEHGGKIGPWTDVYSLGLVILSVARGEKVDMAGSFADAIRKRREEVDVSDAPEPLRPVLAAMLRHDPADRIRSMEEVTALLAAPPSVDVVKTAGDVRQSPTEDAVVAREQGARDGRPRQKLWKHPAVLALAAIALLIGVVVAFSRERRPNMPDNAFHLEPRDIAFSFDGLFGRCDRRQLQRGLQVYTEVCAACHSLQRIAFRDLRGLGYSEAQVRTLATEWPATVPSINPQTGEPASRMATPADHIPSPYPNDVAARLANNNALPPDLSLITQARPGGAAYVASLLTGYADPATYRNARGQSLPPERRPSGGLYFNPYFANLNLAMPPPLSADGQVSYADGTPPTREQMAIDVSAFLAWAADPNLEQRHRLELTVALVLLIGTGVGYLFYRRARAKAKRREPGNWQAAEP